MQGQGPSQYLTFQIAGEEYAVGILKVREIIGHSAITRVPAAPANVRGAINIRGAVVPVVDLARSLGLPASVVSKWSCVIIVEVALGGELAAVGALVDAMGQVIDWSPDDIERPPPFGTRARGGVLRGMGKLGDRFVPVLDIDAALGAEGLAGAAAE